MKTILSLTVFAISLTLEKLLKTRSPLIADMSRATCSSLTDEIRRYDIEDLILS